MRDEVIMRTIVDLPEDQVRGLDLWCQRERISRAEAVRRAVRDALSTRNPIPRAEVFGAWAGKKISGRDYVKSLRAEWDK